MVPRINQASIIPVVDPVRVVGLLNVLVHGVVRQVPEGRPLCGRLPFQSVYPAIERAVGQVVVDGGLRGESDDRWENYRENCKFLARIPQPTPLLQDSCRTT